MHYCTACGSQQGDSAAFCSQCGARQGAAATAAPAAARAVAVGVYDQDAVVLGRIADNERICGILWIVLGALQVLTVVCIIAGIWNIFAGISRVRMVAVIQSRAPFVPRQYEGIGWLIATAVVNFFLGGLIGLGLAAFDFYIRDQILTNRHLFEAPAQGV